MLLPSEHLSPYETDLRNCLFCSPLWSQYLEHSSLINNYFWNVSRWMNENMSVSRGRCKRQEKGRLLQFLLSFLVHFSRQKLYGASVCNRRKRSIFCPGLGVSLKFKFCFPNTRVFISKCGQLWLWISSIDELGGYVSGGKKMGENSQDPGKPVCSG